MSGARGPVRVFIATSLDGFIAGPGDDLTWLPEGGGEDHGYDDFMAEIGAVLMGRTTYDVVLGIVAVGGIYVDGGALIRQFLAAGLIDNLTVTIVPVILGAGTPLFAGLPERRRLTLTGSQSYRSGLVTLRYLPALSARGART